MSCRSLVVAPQWIGDAVMSGPLLARLSARGDRVTVAALPGVAPVYRAMPQVAEVIELPFAHRRLGLRQRWQASRPLRHRFDAGFVLPNSWKSALLPWFAGIARRIGYLGEGRYLLLNEWLPNPAGRPPMVDFYRALCPGNAATIAEQHPTLCFEPAVVGRAARAAGASPGAYFVFAPGAEYGPAKRWPPGHYAALAADLWRSRRLPILLLGSAAEAPLCEAIAEAAPPGACTVLAGRMPLLEAMALISAARGVVSNDSGLMHVAAACGVPQVAVFGSTSPAHTPPLNRLARVLWLKDELQLDCAPCFDRICRFGHTRCLTGVSPERVGRTLQAALDAANGAARERAGTA